MRRAMRLKYSAAALADIKSIYRHSARQFGLAQADRYRSGLERVLNQIAEQPSASREHIGYTEPLRVHLYRSHVIFFVQDSDAVRIVRILHQQQDWHSIL